MMSPRQYTITVWTYEDSFAEYRRLKKELYSLGYAVAARPIELGMPIGASPTGSKSRRGGVTPRLGRERELPYQVTVTGVPTRTPSMRAALSPTMARPSWPLEPTKAIKVISGCSA